MSSPARVIQVALDDWPSSARLPKELSAAGLTVIALCSVASPLRLTRYAASVVITTARTLATELERLIPKYEPAALIASDELSVRHLHRLALDPTASKQTRTLVRRSLGAPSGYALVTSKWATAELAGRLNISVPRQRRVNSVDHAMEFVRDNGLPVILKRENTYGGMGCYVCRSKRQLRRGFKSLSTVSWMRRRFRAIAGRNPAATNIDRGREPLIIQQFHEGQLAFSAAVADNGIMVSGLTALAEVVFPTPTGASTVIRAIDAPELLEASRSLIAATRCSGFVAVDFIIDRTSGQPYLLELNPRVTPLCHLGRLFGTDLCAAFAGRLLKLPETPPVQERQIKEMVALFPSEWRRDPHSSFLHSAYHDVPIDDPALITDAYRHLPMAKRSMIRFGLHMPFNLQAQHRPIETRPERLYDLLANGPRDR